MNPNQEIPLGATVSDQVTRFTGIVTARTVYRNATPRVQVERMVEGRVVAEWFDEPRLDIMLDPPRP